MQLHNVQESHFIIVAALEGRVMRNLDKMTMRQKGTGSRERVMGFVRKRLWEILPRSLLGASNHLKEDPLNHKKIWSEMVRLDKNI